MGIKSEDVSILKDQIRVLGYPDPEGRTALDLRVERNQALADSGRQEEVEVVLRLMEDLEDLRSPHISIFLSFIKRSLLPASIIARKALSVLMNEKGMDALKKAELMRFVLDTIPDEIDEDAVALHLKQLLQSRPWIFAEILSRKNPHTGVRIVENVLLSGGYVYGAFYNLFTRWLQIEDDTFIKWMGETMIGVLNDERAISIVKRKLSEKGIELSAVVPVRSANDGESSIVDTPEFGQFKAALTG